METVRYDIPTADGRKVAVWRSGPWKRPGGPAPVVILCPGFGQKMSDLAVVALYLVVNGGTVYRFDPVDHVGLGDGEIRSFSCDSVYRSLVAALGLVRALESTPVVALGALSLSALPAVRLAAEDQHVSRVVAISGVVHGLRTLEHALGADYSTYPLDDLPPTVTINGHEVDPRPLWREHRATGSLGLAWTRRHLAQIEVPVANCLATDDPWVDLGDCKEAFSASDGGERLLLELPYNGHDLGRNPAAVQLVLGHACRLLLSEGSLERALDTEVLDPDFESVLDVRVTERQMMREQRLAGTSLARLGGAE